MSNKTDFRKGKVEERKRWWEGRRGEYYEQRFFSCSVLWERELSTSRLIFLA